MHIFAKILLLFDIRTELFDSIVVNQLLTAMEVFIWLWGRLLRKNQLNQPFLNVLFVNLNGVGNTYGQTAPRPEIIDQKHI
jgi:hypothetical protein